MTVLEQVTQLKKQGMNDEEISNNLQQQGISPKQITDAINQSNIKNAVTDEESSQDNYIPYPENSAPSQDTYTPSIAEAEQTYIPQVQQAPEIYSQQGYPQQEQAYSTGMDSESMIEIANQVFSDKIRKFQKKQDELNEFKTLAQVKIDNLDERLKKIEKIIDTMQIKILEKVGTYGKQLNSTKKELAMVQNTIKKHKKKKK